MTRPLLFSAWRQFALFVVMVTFAILVANRLVYWQVREHARIARAAALVYYSQADIPAARGSIFDTTGQTLVGSTTSYLVAADPKSLASPVMTAHELAPLLHTDETKLLRVLTLPNIQYVPIAREVDQPTHDAIQALGLSGIILQKAWRATYPQGSLASSILGFVNDQGTGQYGLQQYYNKSLMGTLGSDLRIVDTSNRPLPVGVEKPHPAIDGDSLVLTLNASIQSAVEQRLQASITRYGAHSGTAIVMNPQTGAIMALASLPSYDPNSYGHETRQSNFQNAVIEGYQPGSTFKVVSIAAGLDYGAFTPATTIFDSGAYFKYGMTVHNWEAGKGWGTETPMVMLQHSANVGMVQFADMIHPAAAYYNYITDRFGFGAVTGIDLPNESPGSVRTPARPSWQPMDLFTNSFGQSIDVTPLQLTTGVAALANGGWRMHPYIVQRIVSPTGKTVWQAHPQKVAQVVSSATANTMTSILRTSAFNGEAMCGLTSDYPVAAKTGTATIEGTGPDGVNLTGHTIASLIGWAPANNPKFVMLITLVNPHRPNDGNHIWGSTTAAPTWHDIALKIFRILNVPAQPGSTPPTLSMLQGPGAYGCEFMPQQ